MSDLFHEDVPFKYVADVFTVIGQARRHTFQILTKRPARMLEFFDWNYGGMPRQEAERDWLATWPNVWLGVSAENQEMWDERVELLGRTPAAVRFVSAEPLLGPIDCGNAFDPAIDGSDYQPINWVIPGGESGARARPTDIAWIRDIVRQCQLAGVPVFVKQLGAVPMMREDEWNDLSPTPILSARNRDKVPEGYVPLALNDAKGGNWDGWSSALDDLRVREYPQAVPA